MTDIPDLPEQSMDEFISSAMDADGGLQEQSSEEPESNPAPDEAETPPADDGAETGDAPAGEEESAPNGEDDSADTGTDSAELVEPPASMSAADREAFYKLPVDQQKWLTTKATDQQADYTRKTQEIAETRRRYQRLDDVIASRREQFARDGMDEATAIGQLFALSDFANRDPVAFAQHILQQRGIDPAQLQERGQAQSDPALAALQRELATLKQQVTQTQAQSQQQSQADIMAAVDQFAKDSPFFDELEAEMVPFVATLKQAHPEMSHADILARAYKAALANNDDVRAKIDADKHAKAEQERVAKAKKEAAAARKAAGADVGPSTGNLATVKPESMDDFIAAAWDDRSGA